MKPTPSNSQSADLTEAEQAAITAALAIFNGDTNRLIHAVSSQQHKTTSTEQNHEKQATTVFNPPAKPATNNSNPAIVTLEHVSRQYRMNKHNTVGAVDDLSVLVHEQEFVAITGASGSGKSTLLNLIGGLDRPDSGTISVAGHDLAHLNDNQLSAYRNQTVGFVFQFFYLQPFLSLRQNLAVPAMFGKVSQAERNQRIEQLAEAVGISDRLDHLPRELSGGQMQRAAIARALVNRPKILLADEPTGNLDSVNSAGIMELFRKVRHDFATTIIVVTHDQHIADSADRIITMYDGKAS